jgi:peptide deformylase
MTRAKPVEVFDDSLRVLAEQMIKIMVETKGVGLAGPQAGVNLRIFVASIDGFQTRRDVFRCRVLPARSNATPSAPSPHRT